MANSLNNVYELSDTKQEQRKLNLLDILNQNQGYKKLITSDHLIWIVDICGSSIFVSQKISDMLGYKFGEMTGHEFYKFLCNEDIVKAKSRFKLCSEVFYVQSEIRLHCKDGKGLYTEMSTLAIINDTGTCIGFINIVKDMTYQKITEEELLIIKEAAEKANNGIIITDAFGAKALYINKAFTDLFGYTVESLNALGGVSLLFFNQNKATEVFNTVKKGAWKSELVLRTFSNQPVSVFLQGESLRDEYGKIIGMFGLYSDLTARRQAETALIESKRQLSDIIDFLPDATIVIDHKGKVIKWNRAAEKITGVSAKDIIGKSNYEYAIPLYGKRKPMLIDMVLNPNKELEREYPIVSKNEHTIISENFCPGLGKSGAYIRATASPLYDSRGNVIGAIESIRDATEQKQLEEQMRYLSLHDSLTGLNNRTNFEFELQRIDNSWFETISIILCDVDGLKFINDTLGHKAGDELLKETAHVLKGCFRENDFIARIGGDEFVILLTNTELSKIEKMIKRMRAGLKKHNTINMELPLSLSIGIATGKPGQDKILDLYKEADNNMYREKLQKKNSTRSSIIQTLMRTLSSRDVVSTDHSERLINLIRNFAVYLQLSEQVVNDLLLLAQLHDIGKVGIADQILKKDGPLTSEEYREMQKHCKIGYNIAIASPDMVTYANWILRHHEWWNGEGYPLGLKGEEIPLECRVLALTDAYDAMTHDRPYRKAMSHGQAVDELQKCAGTQFDPNLTVEFIAFLDMYNTNYEYN
jgi:diguanylate cyclase (GGDEF)-like protein/PAS domain S-box-containing protein